jgi:alpha-glucosidase
MSFAGRWWQSGIIYQVYPRSFMDSNGDGVGDLPGIESRLDHLEALGVDAIWLSPFYPSPMADFGYDIANHTSVDPLFGTLDDFDRLLEAAHARRIKVIVDFVPNHTSAEHPWFQESRASRTSSKRSWYLWADAATGGGVPNNWLSAFGGPAWSWDEATGQYYYHSYLKQQPDLNWRNPDVRGAMYDILRFWLDRGVDGFRVDALRKLFKDPLLRDNPPNPNWHPSQGRYKSLLTTYSAGLPEVHEAIRGMREVLDRYEDRVLIGELYEPIEKLMSYYGVDGPECHLPYNFHLLAAQWNATEIAQLVVRYEGLLPSQGWPNWVLGNHDKHRVASRVGPAQARVAAMMLLTLRGTPTLYQGDEIGMCDVPIPADRVQDPWEKNVPGLGLGRDPVRTPMQWSDRPHGGFSEVPPWLPVEQDFADRCVQRQQDSPQSMLTLHRDLIRLRRTEPALHRGAIRSVRAQGAALVYERTHQDRTLVVALNLGSEAQTASIGRSARIVLSTLPGRAGVGVGDEMELDGDEGVVLDLGR